MPPHGSFFLGTTDPNLAADARARTPQDGRRDGTGAARARRSDDCARRPDQPVSRARPAVVAGAGARFSRRADFLRWLGVIDGIRK